MNNIYNKLQVFFNTIMNMNKLSNYLAKSIKSWLSLIFIFKMLTIPCWELLNKELPENSYEIICTFIIYLVLVIASSLMVLLFDLKIYFT